MSSCDHSSDPAAHQPSSPALPQPRASKCHFCSLRQLEIRLDLSQGYRCRLRAGDGVSSTALVSLLTLLGKDPSHMEELRDDRAIPIPSEPAPRKRKPDA